MTANTDYLAIKTGRVFTLVAVDHDDHECRVQTSERARQRNGYISHILVRGTDAQTIRRIARDGAGRSFPTLKALRQDGEESGVQVVRRRDLDC